MAEPKGKGAKEGTVKVKRPVQDLPTVTVLLAFIAIALLAIACGDGHFPNRPFHERKEDEGGAAAERIVRAGPGAEARAEDIVVTLHETVDPWVDPDMDTPQQAAPGRRFLAFDVSIEKVRDDAHSATPFNFKLTDTDGVIHETAIIFRLAPRLGGTNLGAGQKVRGWIGFEVTEEAKPKVLKYDPNPLTPDDIEFRFE